MPKSILITGDCREVLRDLPDESVGACVTDPPYELTSKLKAGRSNCLAGILTDIVLPDHDKYQIQIADDPTFPIPSEGVPSLHCGNRTVGIESRIGVPESPVDFDDDSSGGDQEVKDAGEATGTIADGELPNEDQSDAGQFLGHYVFDPGHAADSPVCDGMCRCFGQASTDVIAMPVSFRMQFGGAATSTGSQGSSSGGTVLVRTGDDAANQPLGAPGVVAHWRTVVSAMLCLDMRRGTGELVAADSAGQGLRLAQVRGPEGIGARSRTGGLPSIFKTFSVRLVGFPTNGTLSIHFHSSILRRLQDKGNPGGFMGKKWDSTGIAYQVDVWAEVLRVLKPGAHLLAFGGTRTYHRMACAIEDAGFEIRDCLQWLYGQGFPKSLDIGKKLPEWRGWGTALKPANEPIVLARKPLAGTVAANVLKHGTSGINVDGCRIVTGEAIPTFKSSHSSRFIQRDGNVKIKRDGGSTLQGRFPANVILTHHSQCCPNGTRKVKGGRLGAASTEGIHGFGTGKHVDYVDASGQETIEAWNCHPECPVGMLGDKARFFYCSKVSRKEREAGCENLPTITGAEATGRKEGAAGLNSPRAGAVRNHHPTVKPLKLMRYLVRLITPPRGLVLDPFSGSGTTGIAANNLGHNYVGIELNPEYNEIARARIKEVGGQVEVWE